MTDLRDYHKGKWCLYYVSGTPGHEYDHFFHKFALLPSGTHGFGKRSCAGKGWDHAGDFPIEDALDGEWSELESTLRSYLEEDGTKEHIHLAIYIDEIHAPPGNSYGKH